MAPLPMPTTSGLPLRAAMIVFGKRGEMTEIPQVPSSLARVRLIADSMDSFASRYIPMSWAITSVSV